MSLARLVVTAVKVEGRSKSEVSREYQVSRRWVHELVRRFEAEGEAGPEPRSRRPHRSPQATSSAVVEEIVALRKQVTEQGFDAGAATIAAHLQRTHPRYRRVSASGHRRGVPDATAPGSTVEVVTSPVAVELT